MRVEQRPWVYASAPELTDSISINRSGVWTLPLKFNVYNVGHLPSQYTHTPVVAAIARTTDELFSIQRKYCAVSPGFTGATVFPGQVLTRTPETGILTPENQLLGIINKDPGLIEFKIIGCI